MVLYDLDEYDYWEPPDNFNGWHSPKEVSEQIEQQLRYHNQRVADGQADRASFKTFVIFPCSRGKVLDKQYLNMLSYYEKRDLTWPMGSLQMKYKQTFCAEHLPNLIFIQIQYLYYLSKHLTRLLNNDIFCCRHCECYRLIESNYHKQIRQVDDWNYGYHKSGADTKYQFRHKFLQKLTILWNDQGIQETFAFVDQFYKYTRIKNKKQYDRLKVSMSKNVDNEKIAIEKKIKDTNMQHDKSPVNYFDKLTQSLQFGTLDEWFDDVYKYVYKSRKFSKQKLFDELGKLLVCEYPICVEFCYYFVYIKLIMGRLFHLHGYNLAREENGIKMADVEFEKWSQWSGFEGMQYDSSITQSKDINIKHINVLEDMYKYFDISPDQDSFDHHDKYVQIKCKELTSMEIQLVYLCHYQIYRHASCNSIRFDVANSCDNTITTNSGMKKKRDVNSNINKRNNRSKRNAILGNAIINLSDIVSIDEKEFEKFDTNWKRLETRLRKIIVPQIGGTQIDQFSTKRSKDFIIFVPYYYCRLFLKLRNIIMKNIHSRMNFKWPNIKDGENWDSLLLSKFMANKVDMKDKSKFIKAVMKQFYKLQTKSDWYQLLQIDELKILEKYHLSKCDNINTNNDEMKKEVLLVNNVDATTVEKNEKLLIKDIINFKKLLYLIMVHNQFIYHFPFIRWVITDLHTSKQWKLKSNSNSKKDSDNSNKNDSNTGSVKQTEKQSDKQSSKITARRFVKYSRYNNIQQQLEFAREKSKKFEGCIIEYFESIGCILWLTKMSLSRHVANIKGCLQCFDCSINPTMKNGDFDMKNNFYQYLIAKNGYIGNPIRFHRYLGVTDNTSTNPWMGRREMIDGTTNCVISNDKLSDA